MACHLNSLKVRDEITYKRFYGDKESYWFAHALTSTPYHFVPGYEGGIGRISHPYNNNHKETICTLQLLHVLESTDEPLWFNNGLIEYKKAEDDAYIVPEAWVGHGGEWHGGGKDFPNQFCVNMPGGDDVPVTRVEGTFKWTLEQIIQQAENYDNLMESEGLVSIRRKHLPRDH